jgi:hypothetical protein
MRDDDYCGYPPALCKDYLLETLLYGPDTRQLYWIHTTISNAKAFISGTYHALLKKLQSYLDEFCFRFSRRFFCGKLFDHLATAVVSSG